MNDYSASEELVAASTNYSILAGRQLRGSTAPNVGLPTEEAPAGYYGWPWGHDLWLPSLQPEQNMAKAAELLDEAIVAYTNVVY